MEESRQKAEHLVDVNSIQHTDAREIGAEWVCLQAIRELGIDSFLQREGWSETQINTTIAHLITRTIYSPSELKSMRIVDENSAVFVRSRKPASNFKARPLKSQKAMNKKKKPDFKIQGPR